MSSRKLRVRQAQTILPFGTGSIIDVHGESFVAAGIDSWPSPAALQRINAPRLAERLRVTGLFAAPAAPAADYDVEGAAGPSFIRFPGWLFCGSCRRMTRWRVAMEKFGSPPYCSSCMPRHQLSPMRFVQVCADGHLGDVDWWYWAHSHLSVEERDRCKDHERLSFEAGENATGLEALSVRCRNDTCKQARRDLLDILGSQAMRCCGRNPWQRFSERTDCTERIQIVQRTAGNVYYPVAHSALDIPAPKKAAAFDEGIADLVRSHPFWPALCQAIDSPGAAALKEIIAEFTGADEALMQALIEEETGKPTQAETPGEQPNNEVYPDLSWAEWAAFTAVEPECDRSFAIREVGFRSAQEPPWSDLESRISRVIVADRLREVRALRGFSRLSPENKMVPVDLSRKRRWLPAVEVFGEGIFLTLDEKRLAEWESDPAVRSRTAGIAADVAKSFQRDRLAAFTGPRLLPRLPLLHTLGHLLIRQLSFESGYNAASLRERVYARSPRKEGTAQSGVLIYTASGDADGTMGGLARQGEQDRLAETLLRLLEQGAWCSADPLCSEHSGQGFSSLNRAACHACALLPETSCEAGNIILDRMLVVGGAGILGFFQPVIEAARREAVHAIEAYGDQP